MSKVFILEDEHSFFVQKYEKLINSYKEQSLLKAEACNQSSETRHDNFAFEDAQRTQNMISTQISLLKDILQHSEIISLDKVLSSKSNNISIWKKVKLSIDWNYHEYNIGWYETPIFWRISYASPLIKELLWKEIWETIEVFINWKVKEIDIISISTFIQS